MIGAGTNYKVNTSVRNGEVFTIVEEKTGWSKLKSGAGWIYLDCASKHWTSIPTVNITVQSIKVGTKVKIIKVRYYFIRVSSLFWLYIIGN